MVDTGSPSNDATWMMMAPPDSALKPLMGCSLVIFSPRVRMSRNDFTERKVPRAMAPAQARITQIGTVLSGMALAVKRARAKRRTF